MLRTLLLAGILAAAPMVAAAKSPELSDANFASAARCIALAGLPQLQGDTFDVSALQNAYSANRSRRNPVAISQARDAERAARLVGRRTSDAAILRIRRDQACAAFVSMGLANNGAAAAPAG
jgi:hypothetical protein